MDDIFQELKTDPSIMTMNHYYKELKVCAKFNREINSQLNLILIIILILKYNNSLWIPKK